MAKSREETQGLLIMMIAFATMMTMAKSNDTNGVYDPCSDAEVQKWDGFTLGIAFSSKDSFNASDEVQLSPCDTRLDLTNKAQLAIFRPRVDEISLLTVNSTFELAVSGSFMVAFAGRRYAARSPPVFVADNTNTITTFTLVLEFHKGAPRNFYWKKFGCGSCRQGSHCTNNGDCAVETAECKGNGGSADCNMHIQLTFSGTDKNNHVLNSWYQVKSLRRFALYSLFANLRDSVTGSFF